MENILGIPIRTNNSNNVYRMQVAIPEVNGNHGLRYNVRWMIFTEKELTRAVTRFNRRQRSSVDNLIDVSGIVQGRLICRDVQNNNGTCCSKYLIKFDGTNVVSLFPLSQCGFFSTREIVRAMHRTSLIYRIKMRLCKWYTKYIKNK